LAGKCNRSSQVPDLSGTEWSEIFQWLQVTGYKLQDDWCRCC